MLSISDRIPIWLPDNVNSGVFTYWLNLAQKLNKDEFFFVCDSADIASDSTSQFISTREFVANRREFCLPILNLGVSREYAKQLEFLFKSGGFVFFHQLYLQQLLKTYFKTNGKTSADGYMSYGFRDAGKVGRLLAHAAARDWLMTDEYFSKTFAQQIAAKAVGFCSSWTGAKARLEHESQGAVAYGTPFYLPPNYPQFSSILPRKAQHRGPIRLGLLGHSSPMKNPLLCLEIVRSLREQGLDIQLVAIGSISTLLAEEAEGETDFVEYHAEPSHSTFINLVDTLDFNLHFRTPFGGEMSGTVVESMARGVPTIGWAKDWLLDLPQDTWVAVPDTDNPRLAALDLASKLSDDRRRSSYKEAVKAYVAQQTADRTTETALKEIFEFIRAESAVFWRNKETSVTSLTNWLKPRLRASSGD